MAPSISRFSPSKDGRLPRSTYCARCWSPSHRRRLLKHERKRASVPTTTNFTWSASLSATGLPTRSTLSQNARTSSCSKGESGWIPRTMLWSAPKETLQRIRPSGPSTYILSTPMRSKVGSGSLSRPKASPTRTSSAEPISPSSISTTSPTPRSLRKVSPLPPRGSNSNETLRHHSHRRRVWPARLRRLANRLDRSRAPADDRVARDTCSRRRQLHATRASDPRLADRTPARRREGHVQRASRDSACFAIDGLSVRARSRLVRAHEDQPAQRKLERFGYRDSGGHRHLLVYVGGFGTCGLRRRGNSARRRAECANTCRSCPPLRPAAYPSRSPEASAAKIGCGFGRTRPRLAAERRGARRRNSHLSHTPSALCALDAVSRFALPGSSCRGNGGRVVVREASHPSSHAPRNRNRHPRHQNGRGMAPGADWSRRGRHRRRVRRIRTFSSRRCGSRTNPEIS